MRCQLGQDRIKRVVAHTLYLAAVHCRFSGKLRSYSPCVPIIPTLSVIRLLRSVSNVSARVVTQGMGRHVGSPGVKATL